MAAAIPLSACGMGGFSLEKAEVDHSLLTGATTAGTRGPTDAERISDEATIRNAVSSADVATLDGTVLAWANADTGSRGAISNLVESRDGGTLCRKFTTSRESYDGVGVYHGEVCMAGAGLWRMLAFTPAS